MPDDRRIIKDERAKMLLEKFRLGNCKEEALELSERRELYDLIHDKAASTDHTNHKFTYNASGGLIDVLINSVMFVSWGKISTDGYTSASQESRQAAAGTGQVVTGRFSTGQGPLTNATDIVFSEKDYATWLLENINDACRADTNKPQIPTSVVASIAISVGAVICVIMNKCRED